MIATLEVACCAATSCRQDTSSICINGYPHLPWLISDLLGWCNFAFQNALSGSNKCVLIYHTHESTGKVGESFTSIHNASQILRQNKCPKAWSWPCCHIVSPFIFCNKPGVTRKTLYLLLVLKCESQPDLLVGYHNLACSQAEKA